MSDQRTKYGFPDLAKILDGFDALNDEMAAINAEFSATVVIERQRRAQQIAAEARQRLLAAPCQCADCIKAQNLPAVQRILALWTPLDKGI